MTFIIQSVRNAVSSLTSPLLLSSVCIGLLIAYWTAVLLYRVTLHPLASYPGPLLSACSQLPFEFNLFRGSLTRPWLVEVHKKYGPIVRVGPDFVSYITEEALRDIYAVQEGKRQIEKDEAGLYIPTYKVAGIFAAQSDQDHSRLRQNLSGSFSQKGLRAQEGYIMIHINLLIQKLHEASGGPFLDISQWLAFTAFDIVGDLAFGESFNCLQDSKFSPWILGLFRNIKLGTFAASLNRLKPLNLLLQTRPVIKTKKWHESQVSERVDNRLQKPAGRPDFMSNVQKHMNTENGMSLQEVYSTFDFITIAGSETVVSAMSSAIYHLAANASKLEILAKEVRSFSSDTNITISSTNSLKYLQAVISEAMRIFPALPGMLIRNTGAKGHIVAGRYVPPHTRIGIANFSAYTSSDNFRDADQFVPERWLGDERYSSDNRGIFKPFSYGPRDCLGINHANAEMRVILSKILWNFDIELAPQCQDWTKSLKAWFLWDRKPLLIKLIPVKR